MPRFRPDRTRRGPDPYLQAKMILFVIGAAVAVAGIVLERSWVIDIGIAVLVIGFLLRLVGGRWRKEGGEEQGRRDREGRLPTEDEEDGGPSSAG